MALLQPDEKLFGTLMEIFLQLAHLDWVAPGGV